MVSSPFSSAIESASNSAFGLANGLIVNQLVNAHANAEHSYAQLGGGTPPLQYVTEIHEGWHEIASLAGSEIH